MIFILNVDTLNIPVKAKILRLNQKILKQVDRSYKCRSQCGARKTQEITGNGKQQIKRFKGVADRIDQRLD